MLPSVWQIVLVGFALSVFVGTCLLALFMPRKPRMRGPSPLLNVIRVHRDLEEMRECLGKVTPFEPSDWKAASPFVDPRNIDAQGRIVESSDYLRDAEELLRVISVSSGIPWPFPETDEHKPESNAAGPTRGVGSQEPALRVFEHRDST